MRSLGLTVGALYAISSDSCGGFNNYLGALRSRGRTKAPAIGSRFPKLEFHALGPWEPLPAGIALINYWRSRLGKDERLIFETLVDEYPAPLSKEEVAAKAGYEVSGGGFNNALGRLRTLELVQGRGGLRASSDLFDSSANRKALAQNPCPYKSWGQRQASASE